MNGNDLSKFLREEALIEDDNTSHQIERDRKRKILLDAVDRVAEQNREALRSAVNIERLLDDLHE